MHHTTKRRVQTAIVVIVGGVLTSGVRVDGHHNYFTRYAMNETVTIEGPVTDVLLRNPHSLVRVTAPDLDGHQQTGSVYATDTLSVGRFNFTLSGRYNRTTIDNKDLIQPQGGEGTGRGYCGRVRAHGWLAGRQISGTADERR